MHNYGSYKGSLGLNGIKIFAKVTLVFKKVTIVRKYLSIFIEVVCSNA
jgi:hypothetical protein